MDLLVKANQVIRRMLVARGVQSAFARLGEHSVHYYRLSGRGSGPPVLLVHGLGGSANAYHRIFFPLARRFGAVFAIDLPGDGFSPIPASGPLLLPELVEVLHAFVTQVVREPAFVVGNSLGGAMSIMLAGLARTRVQALGLVAPGGAKVEEERFLELLRTLSPDTDQQARELTRKLFHRAPWPLLLLSSELKKMYQGPTVRHLLERARPTDHVPPELLSGLEMPTLVLWGKSEKLLPFEGIDYFRAHLPSHAEIQVVDGFGHIPQMERPRLLVERLVRFADRHRL